MNYKDLADDTRVWIYQSDRKFTDSEVESIKEQGDKFIDEWTAHGADLQAAFEVFHNQFIVVFADENEAKASGCSIDSSVRFIKTLEEEHKISLMNRKLVAFKEGDSILTLPQEEFLEQAAMGKLSENTIVFNNLVTTKQDLETKWQVPLKESWHFELLSN